MSNKEFGKNINLLIINYQNSIIAIKQKKSIIFLLRFVLNILFRNNWHKILSYPQHKNCCKINHAFCQFFIK